MTAVMVGWSQAANSGVRSVAAKDDDAGEKFLPDYIIETAEDLWAILESGDRA